MKNCPHCGKGFKTTQSLHKHLIICQIDKKELKEVLKADNYSSYLPVTHDETQKYRGGYEPEELY